MTWGIAYLTRGYVRFAENTLLNSHFIDGNTGKGMYAHTHAVDISLGIGRRDSMKWKDIIENEDCDNCPYYLEGICPKGIACYGGTPIEPPCAVLDIPDDKDCGELQDEISVSINKQEEYDHRIYLEEQKKIERYKKAVQTRRNMKLYCMHEIIKISEIKKEIGALRGWDNFTRGLSEAFSFANEVMYKIKPSNTEKPKSRYAIEIENKKIELEEAEKAYQEKRKQFYKKERGGIA
jgi:hypothetical protein